MSEVFENALVVGILEQVLKGGSGTGLADRFLNRGRGGRSGCLRHLFATGRHEADKETSRVWHPIDGVAKGRIERGLLDFLDAAGSRLTDPQINGGGGVIHHRKEAAIGRPVEASEGDTCGQVKLDDLPTIDLL